MNEVQLIECKNSAAFNMSFRVTSADKTSDPTDEYPVLQSRSIDLSGAGFNEGDEVWPQVHAVWGKTIDSNDHVVFKRSGKKAVYEVTGVLWDFKVVLKEVVDIGPALPNFPAGIPVALAAFTNWSLTIEAAGVWTATPSSPADVVTICNWAKQYGYTIRPTGIKHTWSPVTIPANMPADTRVLLIDTSKLNTLTMIPPTGSQPALVRAGTGATMGDLLGFLEDQPGGSGSASGYSFANIPAPDHLTIGGVLAINGHGTSVPVSPNDAFSIGYGSMSNNIMELTAVVTDPNGSDPDSYQLKTFKRSDTDTKALLTHLGRTIIVEVVLHVVDNYNLRCESFTDISAETLFAKQTGSTPPPQSLAEFLQNSGRVEAIWFPFTDYPWFKAWTVNATQPADSRLVTGPNNYPFSDNVPESVTSLLKLVTGLFPQYTPDFGKLMLYVSNKGLDDYNARDLWGASKNTMFYVQDTTLRVTANGYAVLMKKENVQNAVSAFAAQFQVMLAKYAALGKYPINSPLEIRVTALDSAGSVPPAMGAGADSRPVISSLSVDKETIANGWDVALWLDVLTLPGTKYSDEFYAELEEWFVNTYNGTEARVVPEWSKGWAYTSANGPWTNAGFMEHIRMGFMGTRSADDDWNYEVQTLSKYDKHGLFVNPLLDELFVAVPEVQMAKAAPSA